MDARPTSASGQGARPTPSRGGVRADLGCAREDRGVEVVAVSPAARQGGVTIAVVIPGAVLAGTLDAGVRRACVTIVAVRRSATRCAAALAACAPATVPASAQGARRVRSRGTTTACIQVELVQPGATARPHGEAEAHDRPKAQHRDPHRRAQHDPTLCVPERPLTRPSPASLAMVRRPWPTRAGPLSLPACHGDSAGKKAPQGKFRTASRSSCGISGAPHRSSDKLPGVAAPCNHPTA